MNCQYVVVQLLLCLTLCDAIDCGMPEFLILHYFLEYALTRIHWVHHAIQPSCLLVIPFSSPQSFLASGSFPMSRLFASSSQSNGTATSASVLPMNIQGWFCIELTGLISLLSKELLSFLQHHRIQKHQFFGTHSSLLSNYHIHTWLQEKP